MTTNIETAQLAPVTVNAGTTQFALSSIAWGRLHEVCLRGVCALATDDDTTVLVDAGFVTLTSDGARPSATGLEAHASAIRLADGSAERQATDRAYQRFLAFDREVKRAVTDWQLRGAAHKTHLDAEEWAIVDRVRSIHDRVAPVLRELETAVPQFDGYRARLGAALRKIEDDGEYGFLSGITVDSYHTLWWHLHEELLWALGIKRSADPNQ
jgi:hypothetical protein